MGKEKKVKNCWNCEKWFIGPLENCPTCGEPFDTYDSIKEALEEAQKRGIEDPSILGSKL